MSTIIVWYRNDLRIHDHPALSKAAQDADHVVPLFILNKELLSGPTAGANRNRFLLECLKDLKQSLRAAGANLVIRDGDPADVLVALAQETNADAVYYTADYTPFAIQRDKAVAHALKAANVESHGFGGRLIVSGLDKIMTKSGTPHKVFTPFWRVWSDVERRDLASTPRKLSLPSGLSVGSVPALEDIAKQSELSEDVLLGGESAARTRLHNFLKGPIDTYDKMHNLPAGDGTSRLSAYLHFGCLSPREIETMLPEGRSRTKGAAAWHRQLAWRDFYHYVLYKFPDNATKEFQEKYRTMPWSQNTKQLQAWKDGQTGYPMVDAGMRQLRREGWMHNRSRLVVGSFLVKDLDIDWREGETYFMQMLIDGDKSNNNGNWQWVSSVGVDPAPMYRRLYNPASQGKNYDPDGEYIRRYVPELANVPIKYLYEPWTMPAEVQKSSGCIIGDDYPSPIVDHKLARLAALEKYRNVGNSD